jgi:hypothetical protein
MLTIPPMHQKRAKSGWISLILLSMSYACNSEGRTCYPGDFVSCTCEDGRLGYATCNADGTQYEACAFCGTTPGANPASGGAGGEASGGAMMGGAGGSGGALLPFMSPCEEDAQCETGLCYPFNAKGPHCTQSCDSADDCPPPSPGCNMMGVCKAP